MQWEKNGMKFMSEKWCHKLHSHTQNFNSRCWIFSTWKKGFNNGKLWGKIYEFIYMPLLLPLPVHMCVREGENLKNFHSFHLWQSETPSEALVHCGFSLILEGGGQNCIFLTKLQRLALPPRAISLSHSLWTLSWTNMGSDFMTWRSLIKFYCLRSLYTHFQGWDSNKKHFEF